MKSNDKKLTNKELLLKIKDQESEIIRLHNKEVTDRKLDFFFKESLDLICKIGADGFYKEINPAFIKTVGYSKKELLAKPLLTFIYPDDVELSKKALETILQKSSSINFENRLIKKNGEIVFIQWTLNLDDSKEIIYAIGRDVSPFKNAQAELLESKKLLENTQKISKIGSWEYNYESHKMIWSNELYSIYELKKKKNQDLFQEYQNRFSKSDVNIFLNKINTSRIDKKPFEVEQCAIINKNKIKWVYAIVCPILDKKGDVIAIRGNTQDITEKKQNTEALTLQKQADIAKNIQIIEEKSNAKYKNYVEESPNGIFVIDGKGNYKEANLATAVALEYSREELLKMSIFDIAAKETKAQVRSLLQELKGKGKISGDYRIKCKNGDHKWRSLSLIQIEKNRYLGFSHDITETKKAKELLSTTFERITDAFLALDTNWCYSYVNKKAAEVFNRTPEDLIGKNIFTEFPEGIDQPFHKACIKATKTQEYVYLEVYFEPYKIWFENHIYPSANGLSIFFRNITEEKIAKEKIENNEKRFRALVENNDGIISVIDKNLKVLFRSSSAARITGYSDKEFDEISNKEYFHPDYLKYVYHIIQKAIANPGKLFPALFQVKHKKGHFIWLEGVVNNRFHDSNVNGIIANFRDVTNRIESNNALKIERDVFAKIAATSPGLIYSMRQNLDGSICYPYASESIKTIYGFRFEEIKNNANKIFELIHPDDITELKLKILNTKTNLVPLKGEYRYFHPTKGLVWHEVNSLPVIEPEGTVICHGIITDITERIEAKQKLLKVNRLYLFISQINQMIVRTVDQETLFKEACNIAVDLGNFKMAWIGLIDLKSNHVNPVMIAGMDQKYFEIIKAISTDKNTIEGIGPAGTAAREGVYCVCNDIENDQKMLPWKDEALKRGYKSVASFPIKKFGNTIGVFAFYAEDKNFFDEEEIALLAEATGDVSFALELFEKEKLKEKAEREVFESELRYHTLTEVSPVGVFRTEANGYTTFVNPSWCEMSGLSFDEALGNGWLDAVHQEDRLAILNGWENATLIGEKSVSEYRFVRDDGSISWVMGQAIPEKNEKNEIISYIGTITDITDRKALEETMIIAKEEAETANKAKTNFLANMSHEIRTPLNGIIGFTHLLMKTKLNDNQLDYMSTINESASSLLDIVNDVLDFSKIESGKLELDIEKIDLYKLINQIIDLFKYQAIDKKIDLILTIDENVPQFIIADSMKIKQILVNLLSNALKFTDFGEIRLAITTQQLLTKNVSNIRFSVKDTGKGIKLINNKKIFSSFEQEDNSTSRKFGGTGLGLAISNQLLALMDSKLELKSIYGKGSEFYFFINVKKIKGTNIAEKVIINNTNSTNENTSIKKILIVEDNKINMLLVKTLVHKIVPNAIILTAFDGNEAIDFFLKEQPNLILMDIQMPHKNGYDATEEIRMMNNGVKTPIIAVTAGILTGEKQKCFDAGMDDYLPKPIIFSDLENIIKKWLYI